MTIQQAILHGERILQEKGVDQARWNAERLLLVALQESRSKIYAELNRELTAQELSSFTALVEKRAQHYPLAYLDGTQEFFGREFHVNEFVLIPRPETEEVIHAVKNLRLNPNPVILDLGSGSGNIPITLALEIKESLVVALEISEQAIGVIKRNLKGNVHIVHGDFTMLSFRPSTFDVVTANLTYVEQNDFQNLLPETLWEPKIALFAAALEESYRKVMQQSVRVLKSGGYLVMEFGFGQSDRLRRVLLAELRLLEIRKDQRGFDRLLILQKVSNSTFLSKD